MQDSVPEVAPAPAAAADAEAQWADLRPIIDWGRQHWVLVAGLAMIVIEVAWKADFLAHLYFRQDDFHDLDLAVQSPLDWHYLTFIGAGHLIVGLRLVAWLMVRISLYNWPLASAISLLLMAAASLAALRLLRMLFGEHPLILLPLLVYVACPLTFPDLGEWSSALESVPLQLAIFMAVYAHVRYVRTRQTRQLVLAACWVAFGLLFFEKGLVLPLLLFAITVGFLAGDDPIPAASRRVLRTYLRAWLVYGAMMVCYLVLLRIALHTSTTEPGVPSSSGQVLRFSAGLARQSLLPGMIGGPWQWLPVPGNSYSFSAAAPGLTWLSIVVVGAVIGLSCWRRPTAWRAWAILAGWVVIADMLPVIISRLGAFAAAVLGTETRYVADAVPVLAICLGFAFLPLAQEAGLAPEARLAPDAPVAPARTAGWLAGAENLSHSLAAILVGVFLFGAIWSVQDYENVTTGQPAATYISSATQATQLVPRGTPVMDVDVPGNMVEGLFGPFALESTVIGDISPGRLAWVTHPAGTIDGLRIFGGNGKLYQAYVYGTTSQPLPAGDKCWPAQHNRIVVDFAKPSPSYSGMVRIGYLWYSKVPGVVRVRYGTQVRMLRIQPGLHAGYVPMSGSASQVEVDLMKTSGLCIGDAEAGNLGPDALAQVLPPPSK
jgi:hypothetical protein